jgi:hypothetical protein
VAEGFAQTIVQDYIEIFAPIVCYDSLRYLSAILACNRWRPKQLDLKTAFLYRTVKEDIHLYLAEGSRLDGIVGKLMRWSIYGLKQSPREWYYWLVEYLGPF